MARRRTYRPQIPQNSADITRADTCDTRRSMNPLTGICPAHCISQGYRHASPNGETLPVPAKALSNRSSVPTQFLSNWHSVSTTAPPFRHTPCRFWPQETPPMWRNLSQTPRLFLQETPSVWRNFLQTTRLFLQETPPVWRNLLTPNSYRFCGVNITNGIIISSIEMPPCWKVFL